MENHAGHWLHLAIVSVVLPPQAERARCIRQGRYEDNSGLAYDQGKLNTWGPKELALIVKQFYWFRLATCSIIWFIYNFSAYAFGIYSSSILDNLLGDDSRLWVTFGWNTLLNLFYMPGCIFGAWVSDWIGPRYSLALGVTLQAVVGFIMAGCYKYLNEPSRVGGFVVVYGLFLALGELGPGGVLLASVILM